MLERCLRAIYQNRRDLFELIVVDDHSTDGSAERARSLGARVVSLSAQSGPAGARNAGASAAHGEILIFVDADVEIQPSTIEQFLARFDADASLAAVFGSYDDEPYARNFVSQYRNLLHHFVHQTAKRASASFWGGCGAIRRRVFAAMHGFDQGRYVRPSVEDIELGTRLRRAGYLVQLAGEIQAKHLKAWTPVSMIKADIFDRAYPWSMLILAQGSVPDDLNLRWHHRLSSALVGLLAATLMVFALGRLRLYDVPTPAVAAFALLLVALLLFLNRAFYGFLVRHRGWIFTARAVPVHFFFYYLSSGLVFVGCWMWCRLVGVVRPQWRGGSARSFPDV